MGRARGKGRDDLSATSLARVSIGQVSVHLKSATLDLEPNSLTSWSS